MENKRQKKAPMYGHLYEDYSDFKMLRYKDPETIIFGPV